MEGVVLIDEDSFDVAREHSSGARRLPSRIAAAPAAFDSRATGMTTPFCGCTFEQAQVEVPEPVCRGRHAGAENDGQYWPNPG